MCNLDHSSSVLVMSCAIQLIEIEDTDKNDKESTKLVDSLF
jgi:hypothetical protein